MPSSFLNQISSPSPSNVFEINKPSGGLIEDQYERKGEMGFGDSRSKMMSSTRATGLFLHDDHEDIFLPYRK